MVDFQKQVIERSHTVPVLVDFWASWCGPCRMLGPVLEQLAEEQSGKWELVKVNTEEQQELAQEYGIRSIPNVKLFYGGKVVGEFAGALPKFQVEQWLDANLPDPSAGELQAILDEGASHPGQETVLKLREFLTAHPGNHEAALALAQLLVLNDAPEAVTLIEDIRLGDPLWDDAEDVRTLARLIQFEPAKEDDSPAAIHLLEARNELASGNIDAALESVIDATVAGKNYLHDLPRLSAIALFHKLGASHELTKKYRRRFDMALY